MRTTVPSTTSPCLRLLTSLSGLLHQLGHRGRLGRFGSGSASTGAALPHRGSRPHRCGLGSASSRRCGLAAGAGSSWVVTSSSARRRLRDGGRRLGLVGARPAPGGIGLGGSRLRVGGDRVGLRSPPAAPARVEPASSPAGSAGAGCSATVTAAAGSGSSVALGAAGFVSSVKLINTLLSVKSVTTDDALAGGRRTSIVRCQVLPAVSRRTTRCSFAPNRWERRAHARLWGCLPHGRGSIPYGPMRTHPRA